MYQLRLFVIITLYLNMEEVSKMNMADLIMIYVSGSKKAGKLRLDYLLQKESIEKQSQYIRIFK